MSKLRRALQGVRPNPEPTTTCKTRLVGDKREQAVARVKKLSENGVTERDIADKLHVTPGIAAQLRREAKLVRSGVRCGRAIWWNKKPEKAPTKTPPRKRVEIPQLVPDPSFLKGRTLKWYSDPGQPGIQAPLSYTDEGQDHYVVSHRAGQHVVSWRPPGQHIHVGQWDTPEKAIEGAEKHARREQAGTVKMPNMVGGKPVHPKIWQHVVSGARDRKHWAQTHKYAKSPDKWQASEVSVDMLKEALLLPIQDMAERDYAYFQQRAHALSKQGYAIDRVAQERWQKLSGDSLNEAAKPQAQRAEPTQEREYLYHVRYQTSVGSEMRVKDAGYADTIAGSEKVLRSYKRQGLVAWVEKADGTFVPVKGAKRFPKHALGYKRDPGVPVTKRSTKDATKRPASKAEEAATLPAKQYSDVTEEVANEIKTGMTTRRFWGAVKPLRGNTDAQKRVLKAFDGLELGAVSKALIFDEAVRGLSKREHKTLVGLVYSGAMRVLRIRGTLPGEHRASRIGTQGPFYYKLQAGAPEDAPKPRAAKMTFKQAKLIILDTLKQAGWDLSSRSLKVPHATSPDGRTRLYFKPQALYADSKPFSLRSARTVSHTSSFLKSLAASPSTVIARIEERLAPREPLPRADTQPAQPSSYTTSSRTSTRRTKKQERAEEAINEGVEKRLRAMGAQPVANLPQHLRLSTQAGPLRVRPYGNWVAMRFENPEKANEVLGRRLGLNPYSGKYNVMFGNALDVGGSLEHFDSHLATIPMGQVEQPPSDTPTTVFSARTRGGKYKVVVEREGDRYVVREFAGDKQSTTSHGYDKASARAKVQEILQGAYALHDRDYKITRDDIGAGKTEVTEEKNTTYTLRFRGAKEMIPYEVTGDRYGFVGVRRTINFGEKPSVAYKVDHIPTSLSLGQYEKKSEAVAAAKKVAAVSAANTTNISAATKALKPLFPKGSSKGKKTGAAATRAAREALLATVKAGNLKIEPETAFTTLSHTVTFQGADSGLATTETVKVESYAQRPAYRAVWRAVKKAGGYKKYKDEAKVKQLVGDALSPGVEARLAAAMDAAEKKTKKPAKKFVEKKVVKPPKMPEEKTVSIEEAEEYKALLQEAEPFTKYGRFYDRVTAEKSDTLRRFGEVGSAAPDAARHIAEELRRRLKINKKWRTTPSTSGAELRRGVGGKKIVHTPGVFVLVQEKPRSSRWRVFHIPTGLHVSAAHPKAKANRIADTALSTARNLSDLYSNDPATAAKALSHSDIRLAEEAPDTA